MLVLQQTSKVVQKCLQRLLTISEKKHEKKNWYFCWIFF